MEETNKKKQYDDIIKEAIEKMERKKPSHTSIYDFVFDTFDRFMNVDPTHLTIIYAYLLGISTMSLLK